MIRIKFLTFVRKNLKVSSSVFSTAGTGKFNFTSRRHVADCLTVVRYKCTASPLTQFDKYVVPLYDKKVFIHPLIRGSLTVVYLDFLDVVRHIAKPFWNIKIYSGDEFIETLSSSIAFTYSIQLLKYFRYDSSSLVVEDGSETAEIELLSLSTAETHKQPLALSFQNKDISPVTYSKICIEDSDDSLECIGSHDEWISKGYSLFMKVILPFVSEDKEMKHHRNRIHYIEDKLKIPYEYFRKKLAFAMISLQLRKKTVAENVLDEYERKGMIVDTAWIFQRSHEKPGIIYSEMKDNFIKLKHSLPENSTQRSLHNQNNVLEIAKFLAVELDCEPEFMLTCFDKAILKVKYASRMSTIVVLLKEAGMAGHEIRESMQILNYSPLRIQRRLNLLQASGCQNVSVPALILRDKKFDLYFEQLKSNSLGIVCFPLNSVSFERSASNDGTTLLDQHIPSSLGNDDSCILTNQGDPPFEVCDDSTIR